MNRNRTHALLLALVGGYVLYIAWHLYENLRDGVGDMAAPAAITFIVIFAVAGICVLLFALSVSRKKENPSTDDGSSAKE